MTHEVTIRPADKRDANSISQIIKQALKENNAQDYPASVIDRLLKNFAPADVEQFLQHRQVFVAEQDQQVVGTASLDENVVRTVFIAPNMQRQGIGRRLMATVLEVAVSNAVTVLIVPSSITAVAFYENLGFEVVREEMHDEEKTIYMHRELQSVT